MDHFSHGDAGWNVPGPIGNRHYARAAQPPWSTRAADGFQAQPIWRAHEASLQRVAAPLHAAGKARWYLSQVSACAAALFLFDRPRPTNISPNFWVTLDIKDGGEQLADFAGVNE